MDDLYSVLIDEQRTSKHFIAFEFPPPNARMGSLDSAVSQACCETENNSVTVEMNLAAASACDFW